ncbi:arginase family protein [Arachidicoccus sp.]|uniref:arginase family protein n=1 Tax=Arachidicoccus sp. TaxID=1872624 RepID=UPI003D23A974
MPSSFFNNIEDFLEPVNLMQLSNDEGFKPTQIGEKVEVFDRSFPDLDEADIIILGMGEARGAALPGEGSRSANQVRSEFYQLFQWHNQLKIIDIGNVKTGKSLQDSYAALKLVMSELSIFKAKVVILGGSHDLTVPQCDAYAANEMNYVLTCVDAKIDLNADSVAPADKFLLDLFTKSPNHLQHYNHIGFQSYFVHPQMLETIDKLRFDCFRVGKVKERLEEMEPQIRDSDIFSFDISCIQNSHAPANNLTPNGFNGEEVCTLFQYAGLSNKVKSIGIYSYFEHLDKNAQTAKQISHLLWYLMDGIYQGKQEANIENRAHYNEFHLASEDMKTVFLQSKITNRWWMQLPNEEFISCSRLDYVLATQNEIPERWLRAIERS